MAVLIESINVVINDEAFNKNPLNRGIFLKNIPSGAFCSDGLIYRVGFMSPEYVEQYIDYLEKELDLTFLDSQNNAKDIVVIDMLIGPTSNCDWIGFKREKLFTGRKEYTKSQEDFSIAWRLNRFEGNPANAPIYDFKDDQIVSFPSENGIFFPHDWTPDKAIYASDFSATHEDELEEISRNETTITFRKKSTGEFVYAGIPNIRKSNTQLKNSNRKERAYSESTNNSNGIHSGYIMMISDEEGTKKFLYKGNESYITEQITIEEFNEFAVEILSNEYKDRGVEITDINNRTDNSSFNFIANLGGKKTGFVIRVNESGSTDYSKEDYAEIIISARKIGFTPRLAIATFWVFEMKGDWGPIKIGKNTFRNGPNQYYIVGFKYISLLPQEQVVLESKFSHNDLLLTFVKAFEHLDVSIIEPYLDSNFHYHSDWVFDVLPSKVEYVEYLTGKFFTLKRNNMKFIFEILKNNQGELVLLFNEEGEKAIFYIKTQNGRIVLAHMSSYSENRNDKIEKEASIEAVEAPKNKKWWKRLLNIE